MPEEGAHLLIKAYKSITRFKQEATQTCESKGFKRQLLVIFFFFALDKEN